LATTIDELRHARDELRANARRFRDLAEVASDWVWETDAEDRITYVSPGVESALGVAPEELLGKLRKHTAKEFAYESADWARHFEDIESRQPFRDFVFVRKKPDGSLAHIAIRGRPAYDQQGFFCGYRGVGSNITAQVNARAELAKSEQLATIGQVTSTVSHELRNPLGTIHASTAALRQLLGDIRPEARSAMDRIERNVQRCTRIIGELLSFAERRGPEFELTDVSSWLDTVLDEIEVPADVVLRRELSTRASACFALERLRQAVVNVINNAVQSFGDCAGGGTVEIGLRVADSRVAVSVRDDGSGMDALTVERIFEPLFSTRSFGVGLGMPLVKRIVEQHGGSVEVVSEPGTGSTVTLWLPRADETLIYSGRERTSDRILAGERNPR
ncbi:MAG: ATP-binding protein, partial [Gammaproteobacteria bacterium]|nr:ATP-binding protein [Gammaproteobacteria bacterium]